MSVVENDHVDFVLGEELGLEDLLSEAEVGPFLEQSIAAGLDGIKVVDSYGEILWARGNNNAPGMTRCGHLIIEGEKVGGIECAGKGDGPKVAGALISGVLNSLLFNNLKRKLTTHVHTQAIKQSYEELVENNLRLAVSEKKYRKLAESLEIRVEKRTEDLKQAYARILQQEKLVSVGQLAAGIAHEINNPLGFILSNLTALNKYFTRVFELLNFCKQQAENNLPHEFRNKFQVRWDEKKIGFIFDDSRELIEQSLFGGERIKKIVSDLKGFSHIDDHPSELVDINKEIDRTLNVIAHEKPADAKIVKQFTDLPKFYSNPALICQALFSIIRNAYQIVPKGLILSLATGKKGNEVRVIIEDNGPGIDKENLSRIFEPFFTTRDIGEGMGLGLALAYDVISQLGGSIEVKSQTGKGTRFIISLPIRSQPNG